MELAALFVEAQPPALSLLVVVLDVHADHGAHAGEGVDHGGEQSPVAEPRGFFEVNRVEQGSGLAGGKHRCFALLDDMLGSTHGSGRIGRQDLAHDQVVEQGPDGREVLLDGGQGIAVLHLVDIGSHGKGRDGPEGQVAGLAPREEAGGRVGEAGIGVRDLGGEELDQAPLAGILAVRVDEPPFNLNRKQHTTRQSSLSNS